MGKSVGDDFREAKMTLPIILAHARADEKATTFWKRVIEPSIPRSPWSSRPSDPGNHATGRGQNGITVCFDSEIKRALADIADFCVERAY